MRELFHKILEENNLVNDGDFDWIKPLQEHRLNSNKTKNTTITGISSTNAVTKKLANTTLNAISSSTSRNNPELRNNRTITSRNAYPPQQQLPLSSTNATTTTLNGGSKTTLSAASATKIPVVLPSLRSTTDNQRPIPAKRQSLVPIAASNYSSSQAQNSINVNNSNKEQCSSLLGQSSEATCCFFKRKAKRALQITSTTSRKS